MAARKPSLGEIRDRMASEQRAEDLGLKRDHLRSQLKISFEEYAQLSGDFAGLAAEYRAAPREDYQQKLQLLLQVHPGFFSSPQPGSHFWARSGLNEATLEDVCRLMESRRGCSEHKRFLRYWSW